MSNNSLSNTSAMSTIGVAAIAAISAYWIASSRQKAQSRSDDLQTLLARFEEMQERLIGIENDKKEDRTSASNREVKNKESAKGGKYSSRNSSRKAHQVKSDVKKVIQDGDSDANVVPPPFSDDDNSPESGDNNVINSNGALPKTIVTKLKEDRTSNFLAGLPRQESIRGTPSTANSTSGSTLNLRAPVPVVLISDPGQDLDDEMMFIMARHLNSLDLISLKGVIANLSPSFARARLTRGTLDLLGLHRVPVGIGTDGGDKMGKHSSDQFEETASSYIAQENGEAARGLESGHRLLQRLYVAAPDIEYVDVCDEEDDEMMNEEENDGDAEGTTAATGRAPPKKVVKGGLTIVITSSMKDIAIFVRDNPSLFASKTREVVVMGGCKPIPIEDSNTALASVESDASIGSHYSANNIWSNLATVECEPDSAHNNTFDPAASAFLYSQCQKMNITLTVVSRFAAYAAKMPRSVYDDLALTGSSIGWRLRNSQRASIDQLWQRACSCDPDVRKGLPPRCDRKWFINTFCSGDDDPSRCCADTAWDLVTGFMQYDTIALLAAIPAVREVYFDPFVLPPLQQHVNNDSAALCIEEGKALDLSEVSRDSTVEAGGAAERRRSSVESSTDGSGIKRRSKSGKGPRRRSSCPGPRAIRRAIAQAKKDNKTIETPFESPGSDIPVPFERGTRNLIGLTDKEHNLKDPSLLVNLLKTGYREGILCNHHTQPEIILHLHLRWDNLADTLLTCLMLRSLWDMRLASALGVVVSICPDDSKQAKRPPDGVSVSDVEDDLDPDDEIFKHRPSDITTESTLNDEFNDDSNQDQDPNSLCALAESIRATLRSIGLAHVKFLVVSGNTMKEHKKQSSDAFLKLYESAPPIGVTLVLTATFTSVWPFAESHPDLFRNKTVRVVHTGGALIWPARYGWAASSASNEDSIAGLQKGDVTGEQILVPDPAAQNHRLDLVSARLFYKQTQALSVPMVILSRHVAKECCIPRNFFDVLGSHGGEVGKRIYISERNSLLNLWKCSCAPSGSAGRGNLPERCDAAWFAENFCAGRMADSEDELWRNVEAVNLYSPIALLAALPGETLRSYFQTMPFPVRSATHHVIGLTEEVPPRNVKNPSELRSLVVQSLLSAALANESEFGREPPPMVPVRMNHERRRRGVHKLTNSTVSTISLTSNNALEEVDMWTFSEAARRELFSRTVAQTSKNAMLPKEKKRQFVMSRRDSLLAATIGFIPPQGDGEE